MTNKKKHKILVIEDLDKGLTKGYYAGLTDKIEKFGHEKGYKTIISPPEIRNILTKNVILFSGYATDQQKKAVKAIDQVTAIIAEEAEWMMYDDFTALLHQLRGGAEEDRKLTLLLNPVNPDCFVNQYFIEAEPDKVLLYFPNSNRPKVFEKNITTTFEYNGEIVTDVTKALIVLSTHHDNPHLSISQRASIEKLKETDNDKYLQLGEARFIRSSDVFFGEFKRELHVIEPFVVPEHWHRYTTKDYGLDMLAQYWVAVDTEGNAFVYKELYESNLIVSEATKRIKVVNNNEIIKIKYAPPDLENRQKDSGKSIFDLFRANGESLIKSDNRRVDGWLAVKEWLKPIETKNIETGKIVKTARLKIFSNCNNLIRTLAQVMKDEKDSNDVATEPHELTHALDALRYFCIMRQRPPELQKTKKYYNFDEEKPQQHAFIGVEAGNDFINFKG